MSLRGLAAKGLGKLMGAVTWNWPAGMEGAPVKTVDKNMEAIYYDSTTAKRTWLGKCFNGDCCCAPEYKITSERILYTEWDFWYLCDNPLDLVCCPVLGTFYCCRASCEDMCCCYGTAASRIAKQRAIQEENAAKTRGCLRNCCAIPIGRSLNFFDMDIVVDIGAHQNCSQLVLNEGDLQIYRMPGGDASNKKLKDKVFLVKNVPEVFSTFDDLSYVMSMMDLTHYRTNAVGQQMMRGVAQLAGQAATAAANMVADAMASGSGGDKGRSSA